MGRIVSGGAAGQVRIWAIGQNTQKMVASMKEHKGRVNSVQINSDDTECVSASADGSCIVWSLERFVRNSCLFASTQFKAILYHPDQSQLLTTGSDRKLTYWDVVDGNPIVSWMVLKQILSIVWQSLMMERSLSVVVMRNLLWFGVMMKVSAIMLVWATVALLCRQQSVLTKKPLLLSVMKVPYSYGTCPTSNSAIKNKQLT